MLLSKDRHCDSILTNLVHDVYQNVPFTYIRGYKDCFKLDVHGFGLHKHTTKLLDSDFSNTQLIRDIYHSEMESYLKSLLGAQMQHTVRERPHDFIETGGQSELLDGREKPLTAIHIGRNTYPEKIGHKTADLKIYRCFRGRVIQARGTKVTR